MSVIRPDIASTAEQGEMSDKAIYKDPDKTPNNELIVENTTS